MEFYISYEASATFENRYNVNMHAMIVPMERNDYHEARTPGRVFNLPRFFHNCLHISSDTRKSIWFFWPRDKQVVFIRLRLAFI